MAHLSAASAAGKIVAELSINFTCYEFWPQKPLAKV